MEFLANPVLIFPLVLIALLGSALETLQRSKAEKAYKKSEEELARHKRNVEQLDKAQNQLQLRLDMISQSRPN